MADDLTILVDEEDLPLLNSLKFRPERNHNTYYASAFNPATGKRISLHRLIMKPPPDMQVDHINGNGLDNRRQNLRLATHSLNLANQRIQTRPKSSQFKGVTLQHGRWVSRIKIDRHQFYLGSFGIEEEAASAYNKAAVAAWGEFVRLNPIPT